MSTDRIDALVTEIERLRRALEAIKDTPRRDGILTCQRIASDALKGSDAVTRPMQASLGDPFYFREVIAYLHWRYKGRCAYCQSSSGPFEIDHVNPVSRGGSDEIGNLVLACKACNTAKGTQTAAEFGYRELGLIAAGSTLTGWRKQAERQQRESAQIGEILKRRDE